jgi:hypothetical protein
MLGESFAGIHRFVAAARNRFSRANMAQQGCVGFTTIALADCSDRASSSFVWFSYKHRGHCQLPELLADRTKRSFEFHGKHLAYHRLSTAVHTADLKTETKKETQ